MTKQKKNTIYLTGFMGSGKSTIAPILANALGYQYIDIDQEIENIAEEKISEIFLIHGEEYFRNIERTLLRKLSLKEECVVSLGGGTIANEVNLRLVKSSGILVYLKVNPEQIYHRLKYKRDRPLLLSEKGTALSETEIHKKADALLAAREPFYNQADITIAPNDCVDKIVDEILRFVKPFIS